MPEKQPGADMEAALKHWLETVDLGQYSDLFVLHRIGLDILPDLTEQDLVELGLPLGDRKRLQRAVASLTGSAKGPAGGRSVAEGAAVSAERRQLTVMFCDMVGSTSLSEQFDPEDVRDMIASFREKCVSVVKRYEGFAARYLGDGILVYFGYPNAHEDDAERSVRAALEIVRSLSFARASDARDVTSHGPSVRIGIATGLVVVGDLVGQDTEEHDSAVGETPNLAARLQALAPPDGVVIASSTQSLLRGKFDYQDLGFHALKGISAKAQAWLVVRPCRAETRFAAAMGSRLTPLVNRTEEVALLLTRWQQAKAHEGQVVLLTGEPGIGKSRIVQELRERIAGDQHGQVSFQCSPYYSSTAFHPFIEHLKFALGLDGENASALWLTKLEAGVAASNGEMDTVVPILATLLSIPTGDRYAALDLSPQQLKDATIATLVNHLLAQARGQTLLIDFEDAHWIDPTSRAVLDLLVENVRTTSILVVITCRPEFQPGWKDHAHTISANLKRLGRQVRTILVERVAGEKELPREVIEDIIVKTDGVPLFLEELTKAVLESDVLTEQHGRYVLSGPWHQLAIPATLNDSLMARLDRMGSFKKIAQIGATIGREFSYEILREVAEAPADQIEAALNHLEAAGLIVRFGFLPEALYSFKHVMIQNAAHESLLHRERRTLHAKIARVLAEKYPEKIEREPELLAYHLTESGQSEPATGFWLKAGKQAAMKGATLEAIGHLRRGLGVLQASPGMRGRNESELELRIALGTALIAAKGYAVQEVEENYVRALELGRHLDNMAKVFAATRGLWVCHFIRGDLARAHELSAELLQFARREASNRGSSATQQTGYLIEAHRAIAMTMLYRGRFVAAEHHLHRFRNLYSPDLHGALTATHGIHPGIVSLSYLGYVSWFLGRPDVARRYSQQAISEAEDLRHPFTLSFALTFGAYVCQHLRDVEGTHDYTNKALALSSEHGFLHWKHQTTILRGWAMTELGNVDEGLNQMRMAIDGYEGMSARLASCWFRSLLAKAYASAGLPDAALRELDSALAIGRRTGEHFYEAEIYRLQGEMTLNCAKSSSVESAERMFLASIEVARRQSARSFELRSAVSLARLWRHSGKHARAAELLLPVVRTFTEGLHTPDVKEALELANELAMEMPGDHEWSGRV
ncbi:MULTISPECIES: ATP-binding protein [Bradyrhizobium]|uniref:ATP-binding protein n=1 Tax=Bradyrhizobium TaxID=374 RepID=UPI0004AE34B6|nr:adenylate/guanylate cyclase domain-containing protein [Bradyrhizobium elkanii]WLA79343.1 adenylate/guanylate cyclase domain-containing protein [Bradyrhizobium elkanii]